YNLRMNAKHKTSKQTKLHSETQEHTFATRVATKKTTIKPVANTADKLIDSIVFGMEEVKAYEISVLDLRKIGHASSDYFIVCHGNTGTQVKAISQSVEKET